MTTNEPNTDVRAGDRRREERPVGSRPETRIVDVEAIPFTLPYRKPLNMASGELTEAAHVLVRVRTEGGLVGQAEAPARPMIYGESQASIVAAVSEWFAPALAGLDAFGVEQARERMSRVVGNNTAKGAVDLALHDIVGQACGRPCHRLFGAYASAVEVSHLLGFDRPGAVAEEAVEMAERFGIGAFKVKTGHDPRLDLATVRAVRAAVGEDALLYADANHGYTAEQALRVVPAMVEHDLAWIEEPCPAGDAVGRRRVAEATSIPVAVDESAPTLADAARELTTGAARMLSIKTARTGFTESRRLVGLCEGLSAQPVIGSQADSGIGTLASVAFGAAQAATARRPAELDYFVTQLADDLLVDPPTIRDGRMAAPQRPGLGIVIDEDKLRHYRRVT